MELLTYVLTSIHTPDPVVPMMADCLNFYLGIGFTQVLTVNAIITCYSRFAERNCKKWFLTSYWLGG